MFLVKVHKLSLMGNLRLYAFLHYKNQFNPEEKISAAVGIKIKAKRRACEKLMIKQMVDEQWGCV